MPVAGSADSPSAAHTDPYQPRLAVATSTCQSNALSRLRKKKDLMGIMGKTETERDRDHTNMARLWIELPHFLLPWCVWVYVCARICVLNQWRKKEDGMETERDQKQRKGEGGVGGGEDGRRGVLRMTRHDTPTANVRQPPVGRRPRGKICEGEAERGFSCECFQRV